MRKRNKQIVLRFTEIEFARLNKLCKKAGVPRETYMRSLFNGLIIKELPPPDYHALMRMLYDIDEILKAAVNNEYTDRAYREICAKFVTALTRIETALLSPEKR